MQDVFNVNGSNIGLVLPIDQAYQQDHLFHKHAKVQFGAALKIALI